METINLSIKCDACKSSISKRNLIRCEQSGVFFGEIESRDGQEVVIRNARRIWYWSGAASLSQLAQSGTSKPELCKLPEPVDRITVLDAIEILDVTDEAAAIIDAVKIWKA